MHATCPCATNGCCAWFWTACRRRHCAHKCTVVDDVLEVGDEETWVQCVHYSAQPHNAIPACTHDIPSFSWCSCMPRLDTPHASLQGRSMVLLAVKANGRSAAGSIETYHASRWRELFHARVPTRSPALTPSCCSARAHSLARS